MSESTESRPVRTRHAELSIEEVAEALPGTGEIMRSVGHCFAMSWHAAQGGNWDLGAYYLRRTRSLLRGLAVTRPKYAAQLAEFDARFMAPLYEAVLERRLRQYEARFAEAADQANRYHVDTGHPYIRWSVPPDPPDQGLDLSSNGRAGATGS
jgi:hypothetical protein